MLDSSKKNPLFDAMVKNFSQMAYINKSENGLEIQPHVSILL